MVNIMGHSKFTKGFTEVPGIAKTLVLDGVQAFDDLFTVTRNSCQLSGKTAFSGTPAIDWLIIGGIFAYATVYFAITGYNVFSELYAYKQMYADLFEIDKDLDDKQISDKLEEYNEIFEKLSIDYHYTYNKKTKQYVLKRGPIPGKVQTVPALNISEKKKTGFRATLKSLMQSYIWTPTEWLTKHIIAPLWEITGLTANVYWITWFTSMILTMGIFGAFAIGAAATITGTAAVTTVSFGLVIGIPLIVGTVLVGLVYGSKIISALKRFRDTGSFFENEDIVSDAEEKQVVQQLFHEKSLRNAMKEDLADRKTSMNAIDDFTKKYTAALKADPELLNDKVNVDLSDPAQKPLDWWTRAWRWTKSAYKATTDKLTWLLDRSYLRIAYSTLSGFVSGYVAGSLVFWFVSSVVAGVLILAGVGLGSSIVGSGAAVILAGLGIGLLVASIYGVVNYVRTSRSEARHRVVMRDHPELAPENLKILENQLSERESARAEALAELRKKVILYNAYVEKYNDNNPDQQIEAIDFNALTEEFDLHAHRKKNKTYQITFPSWWTRTINALRDAGSAFFIGRNLLLGGALAMLFTLMPISLPVLPIIVTMGVAWGLTSLIGSYIKRDNEQYRQALATKHVELLDQIEYGQKYDAQIAELDEKLKPFDVRGFKASTMDDESTGYKSTKTSSDNEEASLLSELYTTDEEDVESLAEDEDENQPLLSAPASPGFTRSALFGNPPVVVPKALVQQSQSTLAPELRK